MLIAVTGGIGGGKSVLGDVLTAAGAQVYDADIITRKLQCPGGAAYKALWQTFGGEYFTAADEKGNPRLNRAKLAARVFSDVAELKKLNEIVHPLVAAEVLKIKKEYAEKESVFVLVPLLFESGIYGIFDAVWLITAKEKARRARLLARGMNAADISRRIKSQMSERERLAFYNKIKDGFRRPEYNSIIENNENIEYFTLKIRNLYNALFK